MSESILIFDFGTNEEAAQQARHKLETWKQAFRLGNKISLKFEREDLEGAGAAPGATSTEDTNEKAPAKSAKGTSKAAGKKRSGGKSRASDESPEPGDSAPPARTHLLVKLAFSDHEKLTQQRWLDRIPSEEPFKFAKPEVVRHSDAAFAEASGRFDSLD